MFYSNRKMGLIIKGVFLVNLSASTASECGRSYSALSFRINGNSVFSCDGGDYSLRSNSVAYIPRGVNYVRKSNENEALITVHFETFGIDENEIQIIDGCEGLRPFFETLHEYWLAKEYNKCVSTVYKIFDRLITHAEKPAAPPSSRP